MAMQVISSSRKLILLPEEGAPVVSFPSDAVISEYGADNKTPTVVVCNATENPQSWQGVSHDAGYVLVNEVPEEVALAALQIYEDGRCTNVSLNAAVNHLVVNECADQYTTPHAFVESKLSPAGRVLENGSGIVKRDDRDLIELYRQDDKLFVDHGQGPREMQPDILLRTYRMPNGDPIDIASIPEQSA